MSRLYVLVEGQTEGEFVTNVLGPHLQSRGVWATMIIVETSRDADGRKRRGGGQWADWHRDLRRLRLDSGKDVGFTTMIDLYGLPNDFPELAIHHAVADTVMRVALLEKAMAAVIDDHRFIPYIQRHEFEALVLGALDALELRVDVSDRPGVAALRQLVQNLPPEDVDDGRATAPSKRLAQMVPAYRKTTHGPIALRDAGVDHIRTTCPGFDRWVTKLESLGVAMP